MHTVKIIDSAANDELTFPIAPETINWSSGATEVSFDSIISGDIKRPKGRTGYTITLTGMLFDLFDFLEVDITPTEFEKKISAWGEGLPPYNKKLRLIVTDTPINMVVYLKGHDFTREGGYNKTKYTIVFEEWREFEIKVYDANKTSTTVKKREAKPTPKTYTIVKGDTLSKIALRMTGSSKRWTELYNINQNNLKSKNPNLIYAGEKITIPEGWTK